MSLHPADIDRIIDRVLADMEAAGGPAAARCACHGLAVHRCRTADGPSREPDPHPACETTTEVAVLIDHTLLRPDATRAQIGALCGEALAWRFAAVCVNPCWVTACADRLAQSGVAICTVAGFPLGATMPEAKAHETALAIRAGAREIDMVMNVGALKSGMLCEVEADIAAVTSICRHEGAISKVIVEAALLDDEEKVAACALARLAGADYVKTSTGFGPGGATVHDVALLRQVVGGDMGVKAAGGIRDLAAIRAMVAAGATRIGTSAGVRIMQELTGVRLGPLQW